LDRRAGLPKGSSFRAFKAARAELREGRDYQRLDAAADAARIAELRAAGRIYPSSVHVVLIAAHCARRLLPGPS
jgi:hypothetical protein